MFLEAIECPRNKIASFFNPRLISINIPMWDLDSAKINTSEMGSLCSSSSYVRS